MKVDRNTRGFTIVELLIVIVVIGILAAITIVAYNGVQNRAKVSAAQSAASQASKKVAAYAVTNSDEYPADLATVGVSNSGDTTFQYSVNNTSTPRTFCVTATIGNTSYYINNTNVTSPAVGGCAGHSSGGVATITNLVPNGGFEGAISPWGTSGGTAGVIVTSRPLTGGVDNGAFARMTWSTVPTGGTPYITLGSGGTVNRPVAISENTTYRLSGWVRASWAAKAYIGATPYDASDVSTATSMTGSVTDLVAGTWTRLDMTFPAPANSVTTVVRIYISSTGLAGMATNSTFDTDQVMLTQGSTLYNYADGNSTNWVWNGATNNSTSTGVPL